MVLHLQSKVPLTAFGDPLMIRLLFSLSNTLKSNIINIIIGTGVVGMPYAFLKTGLIAGWILLAYVGYLTGKNW